MSKAYALLIASAFIGSFILIGNFYVLKDDAAFNEDSYSKAYKIDDVKIFVINLDKSKERWDKLKPLVQRSGIDFERVSGVLGSAMSDQEKYAVVDYNQYDRIMSIPADNGSIGCYMSHVKVWREFLNSQYKYAIVMEDDVTFDPTEFAKVIDSIRTHTFGKWDIISFNLAHKGSPVHMFNITGTDRSLVKYRRRVSLAGCYMITRSGAIKLLKKALPIKMPVDYYFVRSWELGTVFYGVEPRMVHQCDLNSEIANQKAKMPRNEWWLLVSSIINQAKTDIMTFIHSFR